MFRIGFGIARRLARDGAKVVVSSRKEKNVQEAVSKLKAENLVVTGVVCHVGNPEDRKRLYDEVIIKSRSLTQINLIFFQANDKFGGIDILISNAAANPAVGPVLEVNKKAIVKEMIYNKNFLV